MINYNIVPLDIKNGLKNHEIASGFNYLILLEAPSNANVTIKINDNTADEIPLKENGSIKVKNATRIYISCDSVYDGRLLIGQAQSTDLLITPPANIGKISEISDFGVEAKTLLQFLPTDSFKQTINNNSFLEMDITKVKALKHISNGNLEIEINSNGVKYPLNANSEKELFCHYLDSLKIHNKSGADVTYSALVMGDLNINLNYIEDNYVLNDYVL